MRSVEHAYLRQDDDAIQGMEIPEAVRRAWRARWNGDLNVAINAYEKVNPGDLDPPLADLIAADKALLEVKVHRGPTSQGAVEATTPLAAFVRAYAQCWKGFWTDRRLARQALWRMTRRAIRMKCRQALVMCAFLLCHLNVLEGRRPLCQ